MSRYRSDLYSQSRSTKNRSFQRKPRKVDLTGWLTDDISDDLDIGPWMVRRVDGETRKGRRKGRRDKSDPRAAPPHTTFLWASKAVCKGIENEALFSQESLHHCFVGSLQVILSKDASVQINPKENDKDSDKNEQSTLENHEKDCEISNKLSLPSNDLLPKRPIGEDLADDKKLSTERREFEVSRLKRLIAIARKHRHEHLRDNIHGLPNESEKTFYGCMCKTDFSQDDKDRMSTEFHKNDPTVSDFICSCNGEDSHGIGGVEENNCDFNVPNVQFHEHPKIRYSYTQGNHSISTPCPALDKHFTVELLDNSTEGSEVVKPVESTPFITTLNNYREDGQVAGLQPQVRALKSANKYYNLKRNNSFGSPSPDSGNASQSLSSGENGSAHQSYNDFEDVTSVVHNNNNTAIAQKIIVNMPNVNLNAFVKSNSNNHYRTLRSSAALPSKRKEKTIDTAVSPYSKLSQPNGVFPVRKIIPDVYTASSRKQMVSNGGTGGSQDAPSITAHDLLMHKGERDDKIHLIDRPSKMLGPVPFRPISNRTPLHRARDTAQKRILGNSFAQETQDLYQKLLSCKHGIVEPKFDELSAKSRSDHRKL